MNNNYDREELHKVDSTTYEVLITEAEPAVKLVMFLNGEEVIAEVVEQMGSNSVKLIKPLRVLVQSTSSDGNERSSTVAFSDWMPLSEDREIEVSRGFIATITTPLESLVSSYQNG